MANSKPKFQTDLGYVRYVYLNRKDTEFKEDGEYKVQINQDKKAAEALKTKVHEAIKDAGMDGNKKIQLPWQTGAGEDITDEEGNLFFKCRSAYDPKFYNKDGNPIVPSKVPAIWAGSVLRIGGMINVYKNSGNAGASLLINKVQISTLVESADDGFDAVDGEFIGDLDEGMDEIEDAARF